MRALRPEHSKDAQLRWEGPQDSSRHSGKADRVPGAGPSGAPRSQSLKPDGTSQPGGTLATKATRVTDKQGDKSNHVAHEGAAKGREESHATRSRTLQVHQGTTSSLEDDARQTAPRTRPARASSASPRSSPARNQRTSARGPPSAPPEPPRRTRDRPDDPTSTSRTGATAGEQNTNSSSGNTR